MQQSTDHKNDHQNEQQKNAPQSEHPFSHLNNRGMPKMVDISDKQPSKRTALACAHIRLHPDIISHFHNNDIQAPKGAVFHTAIIAGIQGVKETPRLIPLCHPLPISACDIDISLQENTAVIMCKVTSQYATGVEMEALTGASLAALTIYDMCKAIHSDMTITDTRLIKKTKGAV